MSASGEAAASADMGEEHLRIGSALMMNRSVIATLDDVITRGHLGDATLEAEDEGWREEAHSNVGEFFRR